MVELRYFILILLCVITLVITAITNKEENMQITLNDKQNIHSVIVESRIVYKDYPIVADLAAAQAILESRLDGKPSSLALNGNNLFGIKDTASTKSTDAMSTVECDKGVCKRTTAKFAKFDSIRDSFLYHRYLMLNGTKSNPNRYRDVFSANTFEEAAQAVSKGGYATDPDYAKKLIAKYNLYIKNF